jgi:hypothetical protein
VGENIAGSPDCVKHPGIRFSHPGKSQLQTGDAGYASPGFSIKTLRPSAVGEDEGDLPPYPALGDHALIIRHDLLVLDPVGTHVPFKAKVKKVFALMRH